MARNSTSRTKCKILDKLTEPSRRMGIQPIKVNVSYVFDDDILQETKNAHVKKELVHSTSDSQIDGQVQKWIWEAEEEFAQNQELEDLMNAAITDEDIRQTYEQCSNTPGPDGVTALMIDRAHCKSMTQCLYRLWNAIWTSNEIPGQWKLEHRRLISKPGKDNYINCCSYRTVSMTDILIRGLKR